MHSDPVTSVHNSTFTQVLLVVLTNIKAYMKDLLKNEKKLLRDR